MTIYCSGGEPELRPSWWRWFRLKEGRTSYRAVINMMHESGVELKITIEGKDPEVVARFSNMLRGKHKDKP